MSVATCSPLLEMSLLGTRTPHFSAPLRPNGRTGPPASSPGALRELPGRWVSGGPGASSSPPDGPQTVQPGLRRAQHAPMYTHWRSKKAEEPLNSAQNAPISPPELSKRSLAGSKSMKNICFLYDFYDPTRAHHNLFTGAGKCLFWALGHLTFRPRFGQTAEPVRPRAPREVGVRWFWSLLFPARRPSDGPTRSQTGPACPNVYSLAFQEGRRTTQ